ncbi:MAG: PEP-CTERM sorting domain-containing protein [Nitrosomonas ureae]
MFAGISIAAIPAVGQADWSIMGLGTLGGEEYNYTSPSAVNDFGQAVGFISIGDKVHAFTTGPNGVGITKLEIEGSFNAALDINNSGQVVGMSSSNTGTHAFITGPDGLGVTDLGNLGGDRSYGFGINNSGQVAGITITIPNVNTEIVNSFITGPNGVGRADLGSLGGKGRVESINDSGQVTGVYERPDGGFNAFISGPDGVGVTILDRLGSKSYGVDINEVGQVVGHFSGYSPNAFITGPDGINMANLGTLGGFTSHAAAINDSGEAVGSAQTVDGEFHAFLFSHGGMTDLNLLDVVVATGWTDVLVTDINNNGQILGAGIDNTGQRQAFLLSYSPDTVFDPQPIFIPSIPEPEIYAMLLMGLGLIGFMAHRRKRLEI